MGKPNKGSVTSAVIDETAFSNFIGLSPDDKYAFSKYATATKKNQDLIHEAHEKFDSNNIARHCLHIDKFPMTNGVLVPVCDIELGNQSEWVCRNINHDMTDVFREWENWLYFITLDWHIAKAGESQTNLFCPNQISSSDYRINKYCAHKEKNGNDTETFTRWCLEPAIKEGRTVSFNAVQLPVAKGGPIIGNYDGQNMKGSKEAEKQTILTIKSLMNKQRPPCNRQDK